MADQYQITTRGLMDGFSKDQVIDLLSELFRRSKSEIQTMLGKDGYIVKKGMDLQSAIKYKVTLEKRGCKCSIEACSEKGQTHSVFPDTVQIVEELDQATIPFKIDKKAFEMALQEIAVNTLDPEAPAQAPAAPVKEVQKESASPLPPAIVNEIGTTTSDQPFFIQTPQGMCCNCGRTEHVDTVQTYFYKPLKYSTRFEEESAIALDLPYCPLCANSVGKYPMSAGLRWLIGFSMWFVIFMVLIIKLDLGQTGGLTKMVVMGLAMLPGYLLLRWIGMPSKPQTSKYTPVIVKEFARNPNSARNEGKGMLIATLLAQLLGMLVKKFSAQNSDRIEKVTMVFSNAAYGNAFKKVNKKFIQQGFIRVR